MADFMVQEGRWCLESVQADNLCKLADVERYLYRARLRSVEEACTSMDMKTFFGTPTATGQARMPFRPLCYSTLHVRSLGTPKSSPRQVECGARWAWCGDLEWPK